MSEYAAKIIAGIVEEVIVGNYIWANDNLAGEWVDCTDNGELIAGIGYTYDGTNFTAPIIEE
jgi:hypothetical protein